VVGSMALMLAEAMRLSHYLPGNCGAAVRCAMLATNSPLSKES